MPKTFQLVTDDAVERDCADLIPLLEAKKRKLGRVVLPRINAQGMSAADLCARLVSIKPDYTVMIGDDVAHIYVFALPDGHEQRNLWACKLFVTDGILVMDANNVVTKAPTDSAGRYVAPFGAISRVKYNAQSGDGRSTSEMYRQSLQKMIDWDTLVSSYSPVVAVDDHLAYSISGETIYLDVGKRVRAEIPAAILEDHQEAPTTAPDGTDGIWVGWSNPILVGITLAGGQEFRSSPGMYYAGLTANWRADKPQAAVAGFFGSYQCDYEWDNNLVIAATTTPGVFISIYDWAGRFPLSIFLRGGAIGDASIAFEPTGELSHFITDILGGDCSAVLPADMLRKLGTSTSTTAEIQSIAATDHPQESNNMNIQTLNLTVKSDMADVTFSLSAQTGPSDLGAAANIQMYLQRASDGGYTQVVPRNPDGSPMAFNLADGGIPASMSFTQKLPVDHYTAARLILFAAGTNFSQVVFDRDNIPIDLQVVSDQSRVTAPILEITGPPSLIAKGASTFTPPAGVLIYDWVPSYIPANSPRALQVPDKSKRMAQVWYTTAAHQMDFSLTIEGGPKKVSLYFMDANAPEAQSVEMLDATGKVLETVNLEDFSTVSKLVSFNASGQVTFRITNAAVPYLSALFFDPADGKPASIDATTQGDWVGKYGADGYIFPQTYINPPDYIKGTPKGDGNYHIPFRAKMPNGGHPGDGGFWVMAKGSALDPSNPTAIFDQQWVSFETGHAAEGYVVTAKVATGPDPYEYVDGEFVFPVPKPGVYNVQYGMFWNTWGTPITWVWPGQSIEIGGDAWVQKPDPATFPALKASIKTLDKFSFGNFGNALYTLWDRDHNGGWARNPANINAAYFASLRLRAGTKVLRVVIGADNYLASQIYRDYVENCVDQMLIAGVVPYIEPQIPPSGGVDGLSALWKQLVAAFKDAPVLYGICNEPSTYPDWPTWKSVLTRIATEIRAVVPDAWICASLEGWSKSATAASADPLPSGLVDCYSLHGYESAAELAANIGHGIPVWVQEFIDDSEEFFAVIADAPHVMGISSWTFNTLGDDALPLVASVSPMTFTPRGQHYLDCMARAKAGPFVPNKPVVTPTPLPADGTGTGGTGSGVGTGTVPVAGVSQSDFDALKSLVAQVEASAMGKATADALAAQEAADVARENTRLSAIEQKLAAVKAAL